MSSKKLRFRPTGQTLESRRCMAAAIGELVAEPTDGSSAIEFVGGWGMAMYQYDFPGDYTGNDVIGLLGQSGNDDGATDGQLTSGAKSEPEPYISELTLPVWPSPTAASDINADELADIITAPGPGGGPHVDGGEGDGFDEVSATPEEPAQVAVTDGTSNTILIGEMYARSRSSSTHSEAADALFAEVGRN